MVLTVTLNPLLENRLHFDSVQVGALNRSSQQEFKAGGKGINVSRQLNFLGIQNIALTFLGGNNGKILRRLLVEENINFSAIPTKMETRGAILAVEAGTQRLTTLFEPNCAIIKNEADEFKSKLEKMIRNCSTVIFSGSSPCSETDEIFSQGIALANQLDKTSILDTYGNPLKSAIEASPTILHNNISEIETSLSLDLSSEKNVIAFFKDVYKKGVKLAFLTNGKRATYASKFDFIYRIEQSKIVEVDPTGSGDAFVAGIALGLENGIVFDEFVKTASALGAANASKWGVCNSNFEEIEGHIKNITVTSIGKKAKLIDDSPTH